MRRIAPLFASLFARLAGAAALRRAVTAVRGTVRDRRGNVMMITAFALIPMTFATGMAIDYSRAARLQTKLNAAADAAALSTTALPMMDQSLQAACNSARNTFLNALQNNNGGLTLSSTTNPTVSITETYATGPDVTKTCPMSTVANPNGTTTDYCKSHPSDYFCINNGPTYCPFGNGKCATTNTAVLPVTRAATVSYAGKSNNSFSGILGTAAIDIGGTASTNASQLTYIDYYVLLDISQSMGIGATQADMQTLFDRTKSYNGNTRGCVFGCHVKMDVDRYSNEYLAHDMSPRINLRIDAAVSAIQTIINDAKAAAGTTKNIRIGVYTMSDNPVSGTRFTEVSAPTSNYDTLITTVAGIGLGNNIAKGYGDSTFDYSMDELNKKMPSADGTGLSQTSPRNYAFIITDGIRDKNCPGQGFFEHCMSNFDSNWCAPLKLKAKVGTIYTTYLPLYTNNDPTQGFQYDYVNTAQPYVPQIPNAMRSCATDSTLYYEASDGPAIDSAMKALFASTLRTARLTQ